MKKIIIALLFLAGTLGFTNASAQQKTKVKKSATTATTVNAKDSTKSGMKKNGTPDMRYKENKMTKTKTVTGPMKKNGTADMRYKSNKMKTDSTK